LKTRMTQAGRYLWSRSLPVLLVLTGTLLAPSMVSADLIFTAPPRESKADGQRLYGPMARLLTRVLGEKVVYQHPRSWLHYQRDMRMDRFDIVFDGPHFISWRVARYGHRPLVKLPGKLGFFVIARQGDERLDQVSDLVNRKVCVIASVNLSSLMLLNEFRDPIRQPRLITVKGGMQHVYKVFKSGRCDAAVLRGQFYRKQVDDEDKQRLKIIYRSRLFTNQGITASRRLDDAQVSRLRAALSQAHPEVQPILRRFAPKADVMLVADEKDYQDYYKLLSDAIAGWEVD